MSSWHVWDTQLFEMSSEFICKTTTESNNGEPVHEVPVEKESPEDTGDDLVVPLKKIPPSRADRTSTQEKLLRLYTRAVNKSGPSMRSRMLK